MRCQDPPVSVLGFLGCSAMPRAQNSVPRAPVAKALPSETSSRSLICSFRQYYLLSVLLFFQVFGKGFFPLTVVVQHEGRSQQELKAGLKAGTWRQELKQLCGGALLLLARSICFLPHPGPSATGPGHRPQWSGPPASMTDEENALRSCLKAILMDAFSHLRFFFSDEPVSCQDAKIYINTELVNPELLITIFPQFVNCLFTLWTV